MPSLRLPVPLLCLALSTACGIRDRAPEGFSAEEWRQEALVRPEITRAHQWIDRDPRRRHQRGLAVEASFQATALARIGGEENLGDLRARRRHYHGANSTWVAVIAGKAERGEGDFGALLAQHLREEAQRMGNGRSRAVLERAAAAIGPSAP